MMELPELIQQLRRDGYWVKEVRTVEFIWLQLDKPSVRNLARQIDKSKSWTADSLKLVIGLRVFPYLEKEVSRNKALNFLKAKTRTISWLKK